MLESLELSDLSRMVTLVEFLDLSDLSRLLDNRKILNDSHTKYYHRIKPSSEAGDYGL